MLEPWIFQIFASMLGGGLAGGLLTIFYNSWTTKRRAATQEKEIIASLVAEVQYIKRLCNFNAKLQGDSIAPFIRFPTTVILKVTFQEPYLYPKMKPARKDLEAITLAIIHINQLIDLRESMRVIPYVPGGPSGPGQVDIMRNQICELCAGKMKLEKTVDDNPVDFPALLDNLTKKINKLIL